MSFPPLRLAVAWNERQKMKIFLLLSLMLFFGRASLDFYITNDGHTMENIIVTVKDFQAPCIELDAVQNDVLLECALSGPDFETYKEHCLQATVETKNKQCCQLCCSPLNHDEARMYAQYGGHEDAMRCVNSDQYCTEERLGAMWKNCAVAQAYSAEKEVLDEYVRLNFQSIVNPTSAAVYEWKGQDTNRPTSAQINAAQESQLPTGAILRPFTPAFQPVVNSDTEVYREGRTDRRRVVRQ